MVDRDVRQIGRCSSFSLLFALSSKRRTGRDVKIQLYSTIGGMLELVSRASASAICAFSLCSTASQYAGADVIYKLVCFILCDHRSEFFYLYRESGSEKLRWKDSWRSFCRSCAILS